jgi:hypothetical protein
MNPREDVTSEIVLRNGSVVTQLSLEQTSLVVFALEAAPAAASEDNGCNCLLNGTQERPIW